jgi:Tfp pilus assembly protein PilX
MNTKKLHYKSQKDSAKLRGQRGIALVFTLLLLTMMIALSLAMAIAIGSQTFIAGYYKNYRGAFYAADSGVNIMRQSMLNQLTAAVPASVTTGTQPIATTTAGTILTNIETTYAGWQTVNSTGSWPEQFEISGTPIFSQTGCTVTWTGSGTGFTCASPPTGTNTLTGYSYTYGYSVTAIGQVQNSEQQSVTDTGNLIVNIGVTPAGTTTTLFSAWGMFIDQAQECPSGNELVPGTITGPVFTNGGFIFTPSTYIFTDSVGFGDTTAGYEYTDGTCNNVAGPSATESGTGVRIAPQFNGPGGLQLGQNPIKVPTNSINQEWAVLDGLGTAAGDSTTPTDAQLHTNLINTATGGQYPSAGASSGVFLPVTATSTSFPPGCAGPKCFTGGGIYVEGSANAVTLSATTVTVSGAPHNMQTFTIVQGSTTTVIQEDMTAGTSSYSTNGGAATTVNNLPFNANTTPSTAATMLYVDGNIGSGNTGLSGPGSGNPAIQDNAQITITANGNLTVTGDVLYKTEPVTMTQNQSVPGSELTQTTPATTCCAGDAADFLIPLNSNNNLQVLGIYTANGNVQLNNQQSSGNLEIDASVAAFSPAGTGGLVNTGSSIGTLNIVGGRIQSTIQNIGATTRNVYFDRRFAQGTFGPPWFPTAQVTPVNKSTTSVKTVVQRTQWLDNSATLN